MTSLFDKLKLRPFERRLAVIVAIVLFLVVQYLFVWPSFGAVSKMDTRRAEAQEKMKTYREEIAQTNKFATGLAKLEGEGAAIPPEDQSSDLMRTTQAQSAQTQVQLQNVSRPFTRTNEFFLEQSVQVTALSTEDALLNFLYNLGSGNSLIRVRDLTLRPDQSRTKLSASIKLVASYQKKTAVRSDAPATAAAPAATKPPVPAAPKPAAPPTSTPTRKKL